MFCSDVGKYGYMERNVFESVLFETMRTHFKNCMRTSVLDCHFQDIVEIHGIIRSHFFYTFNGVSVYFSTCRSYKDGFDSLTFEKMVDNITTRCLTVSSRNTYDKEFFCWMVVNDPC